MVTFCAAAVVCPAVLPPSVPSCTTVLNGFLQPLHPATYSRNTLHGLRQQRNSGWRQRDCSSFAVRLPRLNVSGGWSTDAEQEESFKTRTTGKSIVRATADTTTASAPTHEATGSPYASVEMTFSTERNVRSGRRRWSSSPGGLLCDTKGLASHARAGTSGPAWFVATAAFGIEEEEMKMLIEFGSFYRQKRADKARRVVDPNALVESGEYIRIHRHPKHFPECEGVDWERRVILETTDVMLVNKPKGVHCHPTVDNARQNLLHALRCIRPGCQLLLPHRLDADTSGLVIVAMNRRSLKAINEAMRRPVESLHQEHHSRDGLGSNGTGTTGSQRAGTATTAIAEYRKAAAGLRKRYRALVEILPGYPAVREGPLTHYARKTTWAPKEFRRNVPTTDTHSKRIPSCANPKGSACASKSTVRDAPAGLDSVDDTSRYTAGDVYSSDDPAEAERDDTLWALSTAGDRSRGRDVVGLEGAVAGGDESEARQVGAGVESATADCWQGCCLNILSVKPARVPSSSVFRSQVSTSSGLPPCSVGVNPAYLEDPDLGKTAVHAFGQAVEGPRGVRGEDDASTRRFQELEVELITGRPHQIRGQLAAEGCPIVGDKLYHRLQDCCPQPPPQVQQKNKRLDTRPDFLEAKDYKEQRPSILLAQNSECSRDVGLQSTARGGRGENRRGGKLVEATREGKEGDSHAATKAPGNYVDSPWLALQAFDLRLEMEGKVYAASLPENSCWWKA